MPRNLRITVTLTFLLIGSTAGISVRAQPPGTVTTTGKPCPPVVGNYAMTHQQPYCDQTIPEESMSSHLAKTGGTITPPRTDPKMAKSPPNSGMKNGLVIPAPGSPGGNPYVQPK